MYIESIRLNNFRNYESLEMNFDQGTNILLRRQCLRKDQYPGGGLSGRYQQIPRRKQGPEMIRFENEESHIRMMVKKGDLSYKIDMHLRKKQSKGSCHQRAADPQGQGSCWGVVNLVFFSGVILILSRMGPGERRRFLDSELCQLDGVYITELAGYNHIVNQRNRLLKDCYMNPGLKGTLDVWDMQMVDYGKKIIWEAGNLCGGSLTRCKGSFIKGLTGR